MAFMWLRKRTIKIFFFSSVLLAFLFVLRQTKRMNHLPHQERTRGIMSKERWPFPGHQKPLNQSVTIFEDADFTRFTWLSSEQRQTTSPPDNVLKVVEVGTNVKVPELEVYVVSAIADSQYSPAEENPQLPSRSNRAEKQKHMRETAGECEESKSPCPGKETMHETVSNGKSVTTIVYLTTWTVAKNRKVTAKFCCVFASSRTPHMKMFAQATRIVFCPNKGVSMTYAEYQCQVNSSQPVKFVAFAHQNCSSQISPFLAIERAEVTDTQVNDFSKNRLRDHSTKVMKETKPMQPPTVAVCLPALYGRPPVQPLVEWFEVQRLLGVSRIHIHYTELHDETMSVLLLYQQQGLVTFRPFVPAVKTGDPVRGLLRVETRDNFQAWVDAWVLMNDCRRRLSTYTIVMVLDFDEILIPQQPRTSSLPEVFQKALSRHPDAAYFSSHSFIHLFDWGVSYNDTNLFFLRYLNRTISNMLDSVGLGKSSPKTFFVPSRIWRASRLRHWPIRGFKSFPLPEKLATLHHYRDCKQKRWGDKCSKWTRVTEDRLLWLQFHLEPAVKRTLKLLADSIRKATELVGDH